MQDPVDPMDLNHEGTDFGRHVESFSEITSDPELAAELKDFYGNVNSIDVWVGGPVEDRLPGSVIGELFSTIIVRVRRLKTSL